MIPMKGWFDYQSSCESQVERTPVPRGDNLHSLDVLLGSPEMKNFTVLVRWATSVLTWFSEISKL